MKESMTGQYDFDRVISRGGTSSLKYDFGPERKGRNDLLPLWVADMDFALPEEVLAPLRERVNHGIFGYTDPKEPYLRSVTQWYRRIHGWDPQESWITVTPGVVFAIAAAIRAFTSPGDAVLIQQPVYYPFSETILDNNRKLINAELIDANGYYRIDFEDLEEKIRKNAVKLFLLCNPHNPVGRVWTKEELLKIRDICLRHEVLVFSDEIHGDITYPGNSYTPFASLYETAPENVIVGTAATKTFNLAGLQVSNIFIPNPKLRGNFRKEIARMGYSQANTFGLVATQAAYEHGETWYRELIAYLEGNIHYADRFIKEELPALRLVPPEGTYLLWVNFAGLGLSAKALEDLIENRAKLWLDAGAMFGKKSQQYQRINIACPRDTLVEGLQRLKRGINSL